MAQEKLHLFDPTSNQQIEVTVKRPVTALVTQFRANEKQRQEEIQRLRETYKRALEVSAMMVSNHSAISEVTPTEIIEQQGDIEKFNLAIVEIDEKYDLIQAKLVLEGDRDDEFWNNQIAKEVFAVVESFRKWTQRGI